MSKRVKQTAAGLVLAGALIATAAGGQEAWSHWADPGGRLAFEYPSTWQVAPQTTQTPNSIRLYVGQADFGCQVWYLPHEQSAGKSADEVRQRYTRPLPEADWVATFASLREFRTGAAASNVSVDTSGPWPTQHAHLQAGDHAASASLQGRPGFELISLCMSYDDQDRSPTYERIVASLDSPASGAAAPSTPPAPASAP